MIKIEVKRAGISDYLAKMNTRARSLQSFLNRNVYRQYQSIQRKRWMTENVSEVEDGEHWQSLNPAYARAKLSRFKAYPGQGKKMLVATNTLFKSVIGPGEGFRKITTPKSLTISTSIPYAEYVDEVRSFSKYGRETIHELNTMIRDFVFKNIVRPQTNA